MAVFRTVCLEMAELHLFHSVRNERRGMSTSLVPCIVRLFYLLPDTKNGHGAKQCKNSEMISLSCLILNKAFMFALKKPNQPDKTGLLHIS